MNDMSLITWLIDLVIGFTLLEAVALLLFHRVTGRGVAPCDFALNMASGLCLMLALRCLAHDAGAAWVALCLLAAGMAHCTDLWQRWRRGVRSATTQHARVA